MVSTYEKKDMAEGQHPYKGFWSYLKLASLVPSWMLIKDYDNTIHIKRNIYSWKEHVKPEASHYTKGKLVT